MEEITAVYDVRCPAADAQSIARDIAYEQTVELPERLVQSADILRDVVGKVRSVEFPADSPGTVRMRIGYPAPPTARQLPQLLNLLFGNISMKRQTRLVDVNLPKSLLEGFAGPQFGIVGIRKLLGVYGRPLLATALKPMGAPVADLARMAGDFARGGGDIVKDDHNIQDDSFDAFCRRVAACQAAVQAANAATGFQTLYFPNILCSYEELERRLQFVVSQGIRGILTAPLVLGLDVIRSLSRRYGLAVMAHPTFSGALFHDASHGIDAGLFLGTLMRVAGADFSIFPNVGGRFALTSEDCRAIANRLHAPLAELKTAFPTPAGGMRFETLPDMCRQFGADSVFLIGGALQAHSPDLEQSTAAFLAEIQRLFPERRDYEGSNGAVSSCELQHPGAVARALAHLPFRADQFVWEGRDVATYKANQDLPFRDVSRIELIGKSGEQTAFDLRYFQIEPGGFTSLERHQHTHTVICVRGEGMMRNGERETQLRSFDVAYVPPMQVHQLKNLSNEPFGFFCIVDHERDKPQPV